MHTPGLTAWNICAHAQVDQDKALRRGIDSAASDREQASTSTLHRAPGIARKAAPSSSNRATLGQPGNTHPSSKLMLVLLDQLQAKPGAAAKGQRSVSLETSKGSTPRKPAGNPAASRKLCIQMGDPSAVKPAAVAAVVAAEKAGLSVPLGTRSSRELALQRRVKELEDQVRAASWKLHP
jgi:hypothetical protein